MSSEQTIQIPDHELIRCVGKGAYGEVWLAKSVIGAYRGVKIVSRKNFLEQKPYEREFTGLQKFERISRTHPGFVSVLHVGRNASPEYIYYVMEAADDLAGGPAIDPEQYVPKTLHREIQRLKRLPARECVQFAIQLGDALRYLHQSGLIHRDIKPSNIIFVNGVPKFADIGLVTDINERATFVGTEGYMPPEGPGSPSADLYSFGKVLYEISMGLPLDRFPELPAELPEDEDAGMLMGINEVILRACSPRDQRYQSASEMVEDLRALAGGETGATTSGTTIKEKIRAKLLLLAGQGPVEMEMEARRQCESHGLALQTRIISSLTSDEARQLEAEIARADGIAFWIAPAGIQPAFCYALDFALRQKAGSPTPCLLFAFAEATPLELQLRQMLDPSQHFLGCPGQDVERMMQEFAAVISEK